MNRSQIQNTTRETVTISLLAALMAVCAWITIPLPGVPFTMQIFAVCVALCLFNLKGSITAIGLYLLLGAVGLPVFSGFRGGMGTLFGTTGGYLVGFLPMALVFHGLENRFRLNRFWKICLALFVSLLVCYLFGTLWFLFLYTKSTGAIGIGSVLMLCVVPYILPDLAKIALAVFVSDFLRRHHIV